jgi:hypothetical protein
VKTVGGDSITEVGGSVSAGWDGEQGRGEVSLGGEVGGGAYA